MGFFLTPNLQCHTFIFQALLDFECLSVGLTPPEETGM